MNKGMYDTVEAAVIMISKATDMLAESVNGTWGSYPLTLSDRIGVAQVQATIAQTMATCALAMR